MFAQKSNDLIEGTSSYSIILKVTIPLSRISIVTQISHSMAMLHAMIGAGKNRNSIIGFPNLFKQGLKVAGIFSVGNYKVIATQNGEKRPLEGFEILTRIVVIAPYPNLI